jgi:outer membrane protein
MHKTTLRHTATFALLSLATIVLILVLPSGGELVTASSAAEPPLSMQTGSTPAPRIAVVDTERIITSSKAGRAVTTALEQFGKQVQTDLGAMQTEVRDLQARLQEARSAGNADAAKTLQDSLAVKETELRRRQDDANREYTKLRDDGLAKIEARVMPVINVVAKEGGYNLVFRKFESGLIYADDAMDITNVVIAKLDAATP